MSSLTTGSQVAITTVNQGKLRRIGLASFVAVLYAYCAGGPFGFEAMISTSGPGMALLFILVIPLLFSVPMALATAEMSSAMPVEGGLLSMDACRLRRFLGFPMRLVELDRHISHHRRLRGAIG